MTETLPSPEEFAERAARLNVAIDAVKAKRDAASGQAQAPAQPSNEEGLRAEYVKTLGELDTEKRARSELEQKIRDLEAANATLAQEKEEALNEAKEAGAFSGRQEEKATKLADDLELLAQTARGEATGTPKTALGAKLYSILQAQQPTTPSEERYKRAFDAVQDDAEAIVTAFANGNQPDIKAPFMKDLYDAAVSSRSQAEPATPNDSADDDNSTVANAYAFASLAEIVVNGEIPDGLPPEAASAAQTIKDLYDSRVSIAQELERAKERLAQMEEGSLGEETMVLQEPNLVDELNAQIETLHAQLFEAEQKIEELRSERSDPALAQFGRETDSTPEDAPASVAAPASAQNRSSQIVDAIRRDTDALSAVAESNATLQSRISVLEREKELLKEANAMQAEAIEANEAVISGHEATLEAQKAELDGFDARLARFQKEAEDARAKGNAAVVAADARDAQQKIRVERLLASTREAVSRATTAEARVKAYEDGTEIPSICEQTQTELEARIGEINIEKEALESERDALKARVENLAKRTGADENTLRTYLREQDEELDRLRDAFAVLYVHITRGTPFHPEVMDVLQRLPGSDDEGERESFDRHVNAYYGRMQSHTNLPKVMIDAYQRARQTLDEAAQHARTGRNEECLLAQNRAAREFKKALIETFTDKGIAFRSAFLASQTHAALNLGPHAIAFAHLGELLSEDRTADEKFIAYTTLSQAYAIAGNAQKAQEYLAIAQNYAKKPTA